MAAAASATDAMDTASKPTLYDMNVSNNGARCRMIIYYKGIESEVEIVSPSTLGGLKSPEYLAKNPHGKMPLLVDEGLAIPESDTIARHLVSKFEGQAPTFIPTDLSTKTRADMICRLHDIYIGPIQGAMYKGVPPDPCFDRNSGLADIKKHLANLEELVVPGAPFITGAEVSLADATIFPTMVFLSFMLPKFATEADEGAPLFGPNLTAWWERMQAEEAPAQRVYGEITEALQGWETNKRWDTILGAGLRDTAPATIFDKILAKEIPSTAVYEDDLCYAFRDIAPVAPVHILLIPKSRNGLTMLSAATKEHKGILGHLMAVAPVIAKQEGLTDFRLVANSGQEACQTVFHLHLHIIGGKALSWPPGVPSA